VRGKDWMIYCTTTTTTTTATTTITLFLLQMEITRRNNTSIIKFKTIKADDTLT
jgi:hypothetical protein